MIASVGPGGFREIANGFYSLPVGLIGNNIIGYHVWVEGDTSTYGLWLAGDVATVDDLLPPTSALDFRVLVSHPGDLDVIRVLTAADRLLVIGHDVNWMVTIDPDGGFVSEELGLARDLSGYWTLITMNPIDSAERPLHQTGILASGSESLTYANFSHALEVSSEIVDEPSTVEHYCWPVYDALIITDREMED